MVRLGSFGHWRNVGFKGSDCEGIEVFKKNARPIVMGKWLPSVAGTRLGFERISGIEAVFHKTLYCDNC